MLEFLHVLLFGRLVRPSRMGLSAACSVILLSNRGSDSFVLSFPAFTSNHKFRITLS